MYFLCASLLEFICFFLSSNSPSWWISLLFYVSISSAETNLSTDIFLINPNCIIVNLDCFAFHFARWPESFNSLKLHFCFLHLWITVLSELRQFWLHFPHVKQAYEFNFHRRHRRQPYPPKALGRSSSLFISQYSGGRCRWSPSCRSDTILPWFWFQTRPHLPSLTHVGLKPGVLFLRQPWDVKASLWSLKLSCGGFCSDICRANYSANFTHSFWVFFSYKLWNK